jgi:hypothetical protein
LVLISTFRCETRRKIGANLPKSAQNRRKIGAKIDAKIGAKIDAEIGAKKRQ